MSKYKIIFLRPKEITRFRIQDGFFSDTTLKYIPADTIYSLYLSKLYEEGIISNNSKKEEIKERVVDIKITSAYPYYIKNKEIYFYLPVPFIESLDKKFRKKIRNYDTFISIEYLYKILENLENPESVIKEIKEIDKDKEQKYKVWANIKVERVTRNTINRISSTTKEEGSLFTEEYVFCYKKDNEEFGYYFLIENNNKAKEFVDKIKEFFEIRGIGADKSVSNSVFKLTEKIGIDNLKDSIDKLLEVIERLKENCYLLHPLIINQQTKDKIEKVKLRFLVIDGRYVYPIASDGSKLKEKLEEPIIIKIKRKNEKKLSYRAFYGI